MPSSPMRWASSGSTSSMPAAGSTRPWVGAMARRLTSPSAYGAVPAPCHVIPNRGELAREGWAAHRGAVDVPGGGALPPALPPALAMPNVNRIAAFFALTLLAALPGAAQEKAKGGVVVTSARPDRAVVEAGGRSLQLELRGEGLDQVRGGQAALRGEPLRAVEVRILKASDTALVLEVFASEVREPLERVTLILAGPDGPVRVPVELKLKPSAPRLRAIEAPLSLRREGDQSLAVVIDRPAPKGGLAVELASSEPRVVAVPKEVTIPSGETAAKAQFRISAPANTTRVRITAGTATSRVDAVIEVEAPEVEGPPPFQPMSITTQGLTFRGRRFNTMSLSTATLQFLGRRGNQP